MVWLSIDLFTNFKFEKVSDKMKYEGIKNGSAKEAKGIDIRQEK